MFVLIFPLVCGVFPACLFNAVGSVCLVVLHEDKYPAEAEVKANLFYWGMCKILLDHLIKLSSFLDENLSHLVSK